MAQVLSYDFCEMFKNSFITEHLRSTAFVHYERLFYCECFRNILCERQFIKKTQSNVLNFERWEPLSFLHNLITYFSENALIFVLFTLEDSFC